MKKTDLFVQKIGSSFFDNDILPQQILPALKIFSNEDVCAWRETRARTNGAYQNVRDRERAQCDKATRKKIAKIIPIRWLPAASK